MEQQNGNSTDPKVELRRARAALERRRNDIVHSARAWTKAPASESRRILGDLRGQVEDLEDAEERVKLAEVAARAVEPAAPALPADAQPALDLEAPAAAPPEVAP